MTLDNAKVCIVTAACAQARHEPHDLLSINLKVMRAGRRRHQEVCPDPSYLHTTRWMHGVALQKASGMPHKKVVAWRRAGFHRGSLFPRR